MCVVIVEASHPHARSHAHGFVLVLGPLGALPQACLVALLVPLQCQVCVGGGHVCSVALDLALDLVWWSRLSFTILLPPHGLMMLHRVGVHMLVHRKRKRFRIRLDLPPPTTLRLVLASSESSLRIFPRRSFPFLGMTCALMMGQRPLVPLWKTPL